MTDDLKKRLLEVESSGTTNWYRNPDGREAVKKIEALEKENQRLNSRIDDLFAECTSLAYSLKINKESGF